MMRDPEEMTPQRKNPLIFVAGCLVACVCTGAWGQQLDPASTPPKTDAAVEDPIRAIVDKEILRLRASPKEREEALKTLNTELMNDGRAPIQPATRKKLSQELVRLYTQTKDADFSHPSIRRGLIYNVVRYGDNDSGKPFILRILDRGTEGERTEALRVLGAPGGVSGPEIYDKVEELAQRGLVSQESKATYLARIDKDRARPKILSELSSTGNKRVFVYNARALQDYYRRPEDFKRIIPRLIQFGLAKKGSFDGKSNGLFWIDATLLASYVDTAEGEDLRVVLELMTQYSPLIKPASVPTITRKLENAAPRIRVLAAQGLETAANYNLEDVAGIKASLRAAADKEQDAVTKTALQESLMRIERREQGWRRVLERAKQGGLK